MDFQILERVISEGPDMERLRALIREKPANLPAIRAVLQQFVGLPLETQLIFRTVELQLEMVELNQRKKLCQREIDHNIAEMFPDLLKRMLMSTRTEYRDLNVDVPLKPHVGRLVWDPFTMALFLMRAYQTEAEYLLLAKGIRWAGTAAGKEVLRGFAAAVDGWRVLNRGPRVQRALRAREFVEPDPGWWERMEGVLAVATAQIPVSPAQAAELLARLNRPAA